MLKNYCIKESYQIREENAAFDDTPFRDEFQRPVYQFARSVADVFECKKVLDIGCGSGYKLVNYFPTPPFATYGLELEPTLTFLRNKYKDRLWGLSNLAGKAPKTQLVLCADVIEHLTDPDELMDFIRRTEAKQIIISTPARDLLNLGTEDGPPRNIHHIREWTRAEFQSYVASFFEVKTQCIVDSGTQIVYAVQ